jgi:hypothetical protein
VRFAGLALVVVLLAAGCIGTEGAKTPLTGATGTATKTFDNSTLQGRLSNAPHLNVNSGMTLGWDFPNASKDKPGMGHTLIQFLDGYKSSHHALDGNFHFVAFIPVEARNSITACAAQDKPVKSFLRGRDTGNNNRFGTLVGDYEKGWYHAVLVTFEAASFKISFDADKEVKPRTLPAADPFVTVGGTSVTGGRELAHNLPAGDGVWLAWASAIANGNNADGGRTHKLDVGCQSSTLTRQPPGTGFNQNNYVATSAAGPSGAIDVKAVYTPTLAATASSSTTLTVGWVFLKPIPLDAAAATSKAA